MRELAGRLTVHTYALDAHTLKKARHDDAADRIDRVKGNLEACSTDCIHIHSGKSKNCIKMSICKILFLDHAKVIDLSEVEIFSLCTCKNSCAFRCIEEFSLLIEKLQGVPLLRIMRRRKDDAAVRLFENHGHLCRRRRTESGFHYIDSARDQSTAHKMLDHITGKTRILAHNHLVTLAARLRTTLAHLLAICICKLHYIKWRKALARSASDRATNSGNRFYKCHNLAKLHFYECNYKLNITFAPQTDKR